MTRRTTLAATLTATAFLLGCGASTATAGPQYDVTIPGMQDGIVRVCDGPNMIYALVDTYHARTTDIAVIPEDARCQR